MNNAFLLGFTKKAQEYGLNEQQAFEFLKQAAEEERSKPKAKDILNLDGVGGLLADYPATMHANRVGRATAMAKAIGYDKSEIPTTLAHPMKTDLLATLLGGVPGALAGAALGGQSGSMDSARIGGTAGGIAGSLLGVLIKRKMARDEMRRISEEFDNHPVEGTFPESAETSTLRSLLLPYGGFHSKGESDTARFLGGRTKEGPKLDAGHFVNLLPYISVLSQPITGALQGTEAASNTRRDLMRDVKHVLRDKVQGPRH